MPVGGSIPRWKQRTNGQWLAWIATRLRWVPDAFYVTLFLTYHSPDRRRCLTFRSRQWRRLNREFAPAYAFRAAELLHAPNKLNPECELDHIHPGSEPLTLLRAASPTPLTACLHDLRRLGFTAPQDRRRGQCPYSRQASCLPHILFFWTLRRRPFTVT